MIIWKSNTRERFNCLYYFNRQFKTEFAYIFISLSSTKRTNSFGDRLETRDNFYLRSIRSNFYIQITFNTYLSSNNFYTCNNNIQNSYVVLFIITLSRQMFKSTREFHLSLLFYKLEGCRLKNFESKDQLMFN